MPNDDGTDTRAERLNKLYDTTVKGGGRMPDKDTRARTRQLADLIAREAPDTPVRSPLDVLVGQK